MLKITKRKNKNFIKIQKTLYIIYNKVNLNKKFSVKFFLYRKFYNVKKTYIAKKKERNCVKRTCTTFKENVQRTVFHKKNQFKNVRCVKDFWKLINFL